MRGLMWVLLISASALANTEIDPNGIPPMELQPDPVYAPALEPGSGELPLAETHQGLARQDDPPLSNQAKLEELEQNSDAISPHMAQENQALEALPK